MDFLAGVGLAANLSRGNTHQSVTVQVVAHQTVGQILQGFVTDEHAIDIVIVQRVATVLQLVVVNHRDERVQHWRPDVVGIVVDGVYLQ